MSTSVSKRYLIQSYLLMRYIYCASTTDVPWEIYEIFRSSHRKYYMKKVAIKNFAIAGLQLN